MAVKSWFKILHGRMSACCIWGRRSPWLNVTPCGFDRWVQLGTRFSSFLAYFTYCSTVKVERIRFSCTFGCPQTTRRCNTQYETLKSVYFIPDRTMKFYERGLSAVPSVDLWKNNWKFTNEALRRHHYSEPLVLHGCPEVVCVSFWKEFH
jgi:hypothetical protein